jgi:glucoamylase
MTGRRLGLICAVAVSASLALPVSMSPAVSASIPGNDAAVAPGAPGAAAVWTEGDKHGFGTSTTTQSKVWYTLGQGQLTEVYYPQLDTPSVRNLELIVSDGRTFAEREEDATVHTVSLVDPMALIYRQVNTAKSGRYRITKTYVTDPQRATLLVDISFESLDHHPYQVYVYYDPSLTNNGMDDSGVTSGNALVASDGATASALIAQPDFSETSNGYLGTSDGWTDLQQHHAMRWHYSSAPNGNVVQTGRTALNGLGNTQVRLALGFGGRADQALGSAQASLATGFTAASQSYVTGWHSYLSSLPPPPASARGYTELYDVSLMVLKASEDKTWRGGFIAAPAMPWVWGQGLEQPVSGAYHLVWARDEYEMATSLLAAGDRAAAQRALDYLFNIQQKTDGSFPQNSLLDGTPHWGGLQLDEVADPIILAWQLGRSDAPTYAHVKRAAGFIVANGPQTPGERWENQSGWSPATIAAEIAGLVCAADIARHNGDAASATSWDAVADSWQAQVEKWTVTTNGPLAHHPYYIRLSKDGNANNATTYSVGDGGPSAIDQRAVVDPSFLELVRLGVKPALDPLVVESLPVIDQQLEVMTPEGPLWHRYNYDGYGETRSGGNWDVSQPDTFGTIGRVWPIFAGERGEYTLAAGRDARSFLTTIAGAANDGELIPEQVWDKNPPAGQPGFVTGQGTFSATPLAWSHAQFIRLAWSIDAGRPVEQPSVVACRYTGHCA